MILIFPHRWRCRKRIRIHNSSQRRCCSNWSGIHTPRNTHPFPFIWVLPSSQCWSWDLGSNPLGFKTCNSAHRQFSYVRQGAFQAMELRLPFKKNLFTSPPITAMVETSHKPAFTPSYWGSWIRRMPRANNLLELLELSQRKKYMIFISNTLILLCRQMAKRSQDHSWTGYKLDTKFCMMVMP